MEDCAAILAWRPRRPDPAIELSRPLRRSFCRARAAERGRGVCPLRRHRSIGDAVAARPIAKRLARAAQAAGIRIAADDGWGDIFSRVLVERIEPHLGIGRATFLDEYPAAQSALARPARDPRLAERFELYVCGVELANGFGELNDATLQRRRLEHEMAERSASTASAIRSTRTFSRRWSRCRRQAASRSASTASSCWQRRPRASTRYCGRRCGCRIADVPARRRTMPAKAA